jgi:hypothetical protein
MKTKLLAAAAAVLLTLGAAQAADAHDVTPDNGSQCTSQTTGVVKFVAQNMGSEVRSIHVFLNGVEVGSLLNFTGNGSKFVNITVPPQPAQDITFTWTTDAVAHGSSSIVIDWSKPKCQPDPTTTTSTTIATTTTVQQTTTTAATTTVPETTTTAATTTVPETTTTTATTLLTTTTVPQTTTTVAQTTTTAPPCDVAHQCLCVDCNIPSTTVATTVPQSTTTVAATTVPSTLIPPVVEVAPEVPVKSSLPVTGALTGPELAAGVALVLIGLAAVLFSRKVRSV